MKNILMRSVLVVVLGLIGIARPVHAASANEEGNVGQNTGEVNQGSGSENQGGNQGSESDGASPGGETNDGTTGQTPEGQNNEEPGSEGPGGGNGTDGGSGTEQRFIDAGHLSVSQDYFETLAQLASIELLKGQDESLKALAQTIRTDWQMLIQTLAPFFADLSEDAFAPQEIPDFQAQILALNQAPASPAIDTTVRPLLQQALAQGLAAARDRVTNIQNTQARSFVQQMIMKWEGYQSQLP